MGVCVCGFPFRSLSWWIVRSYIIKGGRFVEIYQSLYVNFQKRVEMERTNLISVTKDVGECDGFVHSKQIEIRLYCGSFLVVQMCSALATFISLLVHTFLWLLCDYSVS